MAGFFLTFEGVEGSGKSTQLDRLHERLRAAGVDVVTTREPGGTALGAALRRLLLEPTAEPPAATTELFLYLADRAENVARVVRPALARGAVVLADRHADATVVYQGLARGLGLETTRALNDVATGGLKPDLTLVFDLPVAEGLHRVGERRRAGGARDRLDAEPTEFHERVRAGYHELARLEPERVCLVPAGGAPDVVTAAMLAVVSPRLKARGLAPSEAP